MADTGFFPYGPRNPDEVRDRVVRLFERILAHVTPSVVVVACNTASVVALAALRTRFELPFVGVVPAVKPAAAATRTGHIAVLSTARTAADPYTQELVDQFAARRRVTRIGLGSLVKAVEDEFCDPMRPQCRAIIQHEVVQALPDDADVVVLACTHFVHVRDLFETALAGRAVVLDSVDGVIRRAQSLLDVSARADAANGGVFWFTGDKPIPGCIVGELESRRFEVDR